MPVLLRLLRASPRPLSPAVSALAPVRSPLVRSPRFFCCPPLRPSARASFCPPSCPSRWPPSCPAPRCLRAACRLVCRPPVCLAAPPSARLPSGPVRLLGHLPSAAGSIHDAALPATHPAFFKQFGVLVVVFPSAPCVPLAVVWLRLLVPLGVRLGRGGFLKCFS